MVVPCVLSQPPGEASRQNGAAALWLGSLWVGVVPCVVAQVPTCVPSVDLLEEMVGHPVRVTAILVRGVLVVEKANVSLEINAEALQALQQPIIFSTLLA